MEHEPVVAERPFGAAFDLLTDEAVSATDVVVGVGGFVKKVAKFAFERLPFGVVDGEEPVFNNEGVIEVYTEFGAFEFWSPAVEVFTVEDRGPSRFCFGFSFWRLFCFSSLR